MKNGVFFLRHRGQAVIPGDTIKALDHSGDHLVTFEIMHQGDQRLGTTRSPLRPRSINALRGQEQLQSEQETSPQSSSPVPEADTTPAKGLFHPFPPPVTPRSTSESTNNQQQSSTHSAVQSSPLPPSKRVANPNLNLTFLKYLDWYVERYRAMTQHSSLAFVIDQAWDAWQKIEDKERREFDSKASKEIIERRDTMSDEERKEAYMDIKPTAMERGAEPKEEDIMPEMDFQENFGPVEEESQDQQVQKLKTFQLQEAMADARVEVVESTVEIATVWLDRLKKPLLAEAERSKEASQWLQQIERLQATAKRTKTVIGVVGNTGAGKSSVINAMLDEERLL